MAQALVVLILRELAAAAPTPIAIADNVWILDGITIVFTALLIAVTALTHRMVEVPSRRFFNRLASNWFPLGKYEAIEDVVIVG